MKKKGLKTVSEKIEKMIVNNVIAACKDITKLKPVGYKYINLCSGFIAHYNLEGFKDYYSQNSLSSDILLNVRINSKNNRKQDDIDYDHYEQDARMYKTICERLTSHA